MAAFATTCAVLPTFTEGRVMIPVASPCSRIPHCSSSSLMCLPPLPLPPSNGVLRIRRQAARTNGVRNSKRFLTMATGESISSRDSAADIQTELPEILKSIQETWDGLDDKYALASLIVASLIALWASTGLISAVDRLPLIPGILELVGIGYTGWFTYQYLVFKPDREALVAKIKCTYEDIIGRT